LSLALLGEGLKKGCSTGKVRFAQAKLHPEQPFYGRA
jgi:hypothetical protein